MGWQHNVFLICGAKIDQAQFKQIALLFFDKLDWNNEYMMDDFYNDIMEGIPIPTANMGSPYKLKQYNLYDEPYYYIVLDDYGILAYSSNSPSDEFKQIQLPNEDEITIFNNFLQLKNINYNYNTYLQVTD